MDTFLHMNLMYLSPWYPLPEEIRHKIFESPDPSVSWYIFWVTGTPWLTWNSVWFFEDSRKNVFEVYGNYRENQFHILAVAITLSLFHILAVAITLSLFHILAVAITLSLFHILAVAITLSLISSVRGITVIWIRFKWMLYLIRFSHHSDLISQ